MSGRKRVWVLVVAAGAALHLGVAVAAKAPAKDVPVTSMILDYAADVAPRLNVQSDGNGNYLNSANLISTIQAIGDWLLDGRNVKHPSRTIYVDFSQPIAGSAPGGGNPTAPPSGLFIFRILAQCSAYSNSLFSFTGGAVKTCPLRVGFDYNGKNWALVMDPSANAANGPFPETNPATVTCIFPTTGSSACSQWKFTPSGTYIAADNTVKYRNVAKLLEDPTGAAIDHGDFYVSFDFIVAK
jgi:hypothetical protein